MKILWITGFVIPDAASEIGGGKIVYGGWVGEMIAELSKIPQIELGVAMKSDCASLKKINKGKLTYYLLPKNQRDKYDVYENDCKYVLDEFKPDILHAEGSELAYTLRFLKTWKGKNIVSIQGIVNGIIPYEYGGISLGDLFVSFDIRDILFGFLLFINKKLILKKRILKEAQSINLAKNILGRTLWDRAHTYAINPNAPYFHCSRILRQSFYKTCWNPGAVEEHTIFISNASIARKGAHFVIHALSILKKEFPKVKLYIAGENPQSNSLKDWKKIFGFPNYLLRLIKKLGLNESIVFLGVLDEEQLSSTLSNKNVFVLSSLIENSPNSLAEAMIMGVPCVASFSGGVPDMAEDNKEVLLYRANDPEMLAFQIRRIFTDNQLAEKLSCSARKKALQTHDRQNNLSQLLKAYSKISSELN